MTAFMLALAIFIPFQFIYVVLRLMNTPRAETIDIVVIQMMLFNIIFTSTYYAIG